MKAYHCRRAIAAAYHSSHSTRAGKARQGPFCLCPGCARRVLKLLSTAKELLDSGTVDGQQLEQMMVQQLRVSLLPCGMPHIRALLHKVFLCFRLHVMSIAEDASR